MPTLTCKTCGYEHEMKSWNASNKLEWSDIFLPSRAIICGACSHVLVDLSGEASIKVDGGDVTFKS